jgi:inorganic triphosphatase YgiF
MEAPETELKFEVGKGTLAKLRKHPAFAAPAKTSQLHSIYFDTPGYDLKRAGLGLRVREADGAFVQTVKRRKSASLVARSEWEADVPEGRPDPAALAATPAARLLDHEAGELEPVFATKVERAKRLWTSGETIIEVCLDRGEITAGRRREPLNELELELKAGDPAALFSLAQMLAECAPLRLSFDSKAERGYRLAAGEDGAPRRAQIGVVTPEVDAAEGFRQIGWSCLAQVSANAQVLRQRRSVEALHQARVGLRRFRAALTAFRPMMQGDGLDELEAESKWLAGELDAARNIDVFIQDSFRPAEPATEDRGAYARFGARLLHAQTEAYEQALAAVESPRYAALLLKAAAWLEVGAWTRNHDPLLKRLREQPAAEFAGKRLDHLRRQVAKRGRKLEDLDAAGRHRLRIKAKKLRYAAEFFAQCFGDKAARRCKAYLGALEALQDRLGQLNDIVVARQVASGLVEGQSHDVAFAAGLVVGARRNEAETIGKGLRRAFARFDDVKPFWR